jgi:hypothetical protein
VNGQSHTMSRPVDAVQMRNFLTGFRDVMKLNRGVGDGFGPASQKAKDASSAKDCLFEKLPSLNRNGVIIFSYSYL